MLYLPVEHVTVRVTRYIMLHQFFYSTSYYIINYNNINLYGNNNYQNLIIKYKILINKNAF